MNRHYELVLMLDPEAADSARDGLADEVRKQIESAGTLDRADNWGMRKIAYEIRQRNEADYRYYRFQGEPELLERLDHNLKIADGVLRFRIFKVDPETTDEPAPRRPSGPRPSATGAAGSRRPRATAAAATTATSSGRSASPQFRRFPLSRRGKRTPAGCLRSKFGIERRGADHLAGVEHQRRW